MNEMDELDELIKEFSKKNLISEPHILLYECRFRLGKLSPTIKVNIFYYPGYPEPYYFDQSYLIRTPLQGSEYDTSGFASSPKIALHKAIDALTTFYNSAVREGHIPDDKWLVENEFFNE